MTDRFRRAVKVKREIDFRSVIKRGQRWSCPLFTIYSMQNGFLRSRFGLITPGKMGNAVERNRTKRRMREILRRQKPIGTLKRDILFRFTENAARAGAETLTNAVSQWLEALKS